MAEDAPATRFDDLECVVLDKTQRPLFYNYSDGHLARLDFKECTKIKDITQQLQKSLSLN